jgi:Cu(I)/Ag(I) efflux system membrane fusion protein
MGAAMFAFTNCGGKKAESHEHGEGGHTHEEATATAAEASAPQFDVDGAFQNQLAGVFTAYVSLKDAFVASDAAKLKTEATATQNALAKTDMKLLSGVAHNDWMTYLGSMESALKEIQSATDIEAQRKSFSTLSNEFYKSIKAFGLGGTTAYYEFCPMAFNNEGAFWLSEAEQIRNPYFGDQMLTCGSVKETLK